MPTSEKGSAADVAYETLREQIIRGILGPNTMLSETTLGAELGISRTPVRTALARLQDDGLITVYANRGAMVQGMSERQIRDLAAAEYFMETGAIRAAPPARVRALARELTPHMDQQREAIAQRDTARFVDLCVSFHRAFVEASGNPILVELYSRLADRQRFALFSYGDTLLERGDQLLEEHAALVRCLAHADADGFCEASRSHLSETYHQDM